VHGRNLASQKNSDPEIQMLYAPFAGLIQGAMEFGMGSLMLDSAMRVLCLGDSGWIHAAGVAFLQRHLHRGKGKHCGKAIDKSVMLISDRMSHLPLSYEAWRLLLGPSLRSC
jgi:hypothetical protein